jgi:hypothetical protein
MKTKPLPNKQRVFFNLTPFIPPSLKGEGEEIFREGLRPSLFYSSLRLRIHLPMMESVKKEESKRGEVSLN